MADKMEQSKIILYTSDEGNISVDVYFQDKTFWLTQKAMGELFTVETPTINEHLKGIYSSGELVENATIRNFRIVQKEGTRDVSRDIKYYNLDAIIAVGYRAYNTSHGSSLIFRWRLHRKQEYFSIGHRDLWRPR